MSKYKLTGKSPKQPAKDKKVKYKKRRIGSDSRVAISDMKIERIVKFTFWAATLVYGFLCFYLYYRQSIQPLDENNRLFQSDLPYHISMVIDDGWYYSLTAIFYVILHKLAGGGTVLIALLLAIVSAATILVTEKVLVKLGIKLKAVSCFGAFILNMVMPFYIKWAGAYRYVSYQSGNIWHNSTYQCMKLAAICCMLMYLSIDEHFEKDGIALKEWIWFSALLILCTALKPSFLTVFAPAFAIRLLFSLIRGKVSFKRAFIWGITVLPACAVVLLQNAVLFGKETENGFKLSFMETFSFHADHPKITVLLSLAFPIIILLECLIGLLKKGSLFKNIAADKTGAFAVMMTVIGFAEASMLIETGSRSRDGNFLWGYSFAMFWLYTVCFKKWYEMLKEKKWIAFGIGSAVLAYQLFCGIFFFDRLLGGMTYFMQQ